AVQSRFYARSALAPSRLRPVVKHASPVGQPRRGIGRMSKPHAAASRPQSFPSVAMRQNAHPPASPTFPCRQRGSRQTARLLSFLALLPRPRGLYLLNGSKVPWRSFRREGTLPVEARAMALNQVTLDDKFDLAKSRIFVTGFQAIVRLCLMQKE